MTLNRYIIISLVVHAVLVFAAGSLNIASEPPEEVFSVDIIEPEAPSEAPPSETQKPAEIQKPPETIKKPPVTRHHRRPPAKTSPPQTAPETMFGQGEEEMTSPDKTDKNTEGTENKTADDRNTDNAEAEEKSADDSEKSGGKSDLPGPSLLFDRKVIEKFASRPPPDKGTGLTFDTAEFRHRGYMRLLKEKIESVWRYPEEAAKLGISGDLYVRFIIKRNGQIGEIELVRTSGHNHLDEAVIKALKKAAPYWPLPDDWEEEDLEVTGHFIYVFGRTHIM